MGSTEQAGLTVIVMRLCIIANPNSIHIHRWTDYFAQRGHQVHLIGEKPLLGPPPRGAIFYDLTRHTNRRKLRYLAWAQSVRRLVRQIRPHVLHAHQVSSAGWLAAASGYHPFEVTAWGSDLLVNPQRSDVQQWLARWVLGRADYVTCVSAHLAQTALAMGADAQRLEVAPWGVDTAVFQPLKGHARRTLKSALGFADGPVVASIRAIQPIYNPLVVARSIPIIVAEVPSAQVIVFVYNEDSELLARFQEVVRAAQAEHAVRYVHSLPDDLAIARYLQVADVAISVPSSDGTPISVLESMASGAVPVVSDLPSLHEWVLPQENGLFVPVGDHVSLAAAVVRVLDHEDLAVDLRQHAVDTIRKRGDRRMWMQRHEEIYRLLSEGRRP